MSVLVGTDTRLCVAGITGSEGRFHTLNNRDYGTNVVSGVTPGKGGQDVEGFRLQHLPRRRRGERREHGNDFCAAAVCSRLNP